MPPKRKRSSVTEATSANTFTSVNTQKFSPTVLAGNSTTRKPPATNRQSLQRAKVDTNPDQNSEVIDGKVAQRASPDADEKSESLDLGKVATAPPETPMRNGKTNRVKREREDSEILSEVDLDIIVRPATKKQNKSPKKSSIAAKKASDEIKAFKAEQSKKKLTEVKTKNAEDGDEWDNRHDINGDELGPIDDAEVLKLGAARPPPVNSDYLPLPWKGRLGYACLNTYLRFSNPPVFSSRTCRIASILEHRHPLKDPTQPEHVSKNRPDKSQPASVERGQRYVEELGLANAKDVVKILKWNDKYGIKFLRLSSEMFPFASHNEYGYKLAPFASETLAEVGRVASELGHRLSTHPGQFTQLGSPRKEVIGSAIRDLVYHDEMLSLLKLPAQMNRDAVMILHLGGTFGDKAATLDRFRENYKNLSPSVKRRIVLENDDVSWSVHDLLPLCEELNIPLCLDFHHHNIIFDSAELREGTLDIMELYPRIKATWDRKHIRQKMHYSEPCPEAITGRQRRKHNPRPVTLPPCPSDMDLMIEAKDKEQAVFELMRIFKLPGWNTFNNIIPYERSDDNKPLSKKPKKKKTKKQIAAEIEEYGKELSEEEEKYLVPEEDVGMGGKENRVYWPIGMEEWLRPKKREVGKKGGDEVDEYELFKNPTPSNFAARKMIEAKNKEPFTDELKEKLKDAMNVTEVQNILEGIEAGRAAAQAQAVDDAKLAKKASLAKKLTPMRKKLVKSVPTPSLSNMDDEEEEEDLYMPDLSTEETAPFQSTITVPTRQSGRAKGRQSYTEVDLDEE